MQSVIYESHTCVVINLLTREASDRIYVPVDAGLSSSVLLAAVFSTESASTKTLEYERWCFNVLDARPSD